MCSADIVCVVSNVSVVPSVWWSTTVTGMPGASVGEPEHVDGVVETDLLVVARVLEGQREDTLLLQVRLVDARERPHQHDPAPHVAGLHRRVLRDDPSP